MNANNQDEDNSAAKDECAHGTPPGKHCEECAEAVRQLENEQDDK